jgi:hypothetical protein
MIISIDQSPRWKALHAVPDDLSQILEALFRSRRGRRRASRLEVILLARVLECPEAIIERYFAGSRK